MLVFQRVFSTARVFLFDSFLVSCKHFFRVSSSKIVNFNNIHLFQMDTETSGVQLLFQLRGDELEHF